ncbi:MAG TPA: hypothetical protein VHP31_06885 [Caproicibacter sp.]|nr:hypothetical protein [Caproicibacter sp.]
MTRSKSISRAVSFILTLCIMISCALCFPFTKASASTAPNVQLYYAQLSGPGEAAYDGYTGYVAIKNLAYEKNVTIHYTNNGSDWHDAAASYVKADPNDPDYEIWQFSFLMPGSPLTFAVEYQVNGQTYWDNNDGNNYYVSSADPIVLGKCALKTTRVFAPENQAIYLKNLAYEKDVKVRWTTDNGASYQEVNATYDSTLPNGVEKWDIPSSIPNGANFVVSYTANGITYNDDNFGIGYTYYKNY